MKDEKKNGLDIDFGIGKFNFGGLFNGMEKLLDLATKLKEADEGASELKKEGEIDLSHLKDGMKAVFGFSVKTAVGGKTVVEPFGNIKKTPEGPKVDTSREPITDVFNEEGEVRVYVEMPGVNHQDIKLDLKDDILDISASTRKRKYQKEIHLPAEVNAETLTSTYKNGILEIIIKK